MHTTVNTSTLQTRVRKTFSSETITLGVGSRMKLVYLIRRGWNARRSLTIRLNGEGAACDIVCIFYGTGSERYPCDISILHAAQRTRTRVLIRSVLDDASSIDCNALLRISTGARGADTYFSHRTLLISARARATTVPALEIMTSDVKAGHAVATGRLDEEMLLYCAARGLDQHQATSLIIPGFLSADLSLLGHDLSRRVTAHIPLVSSL